MSTKTELYSTYGICTKCSHWELRVVNSIYSPFTFCHCHSPEPGRRDFTVVRGIRISCSVFQPRSSWGPEELEVVI